MEVYVTSSLSAVPIHTLILSYRLDGHIHYRATCWWSILWICLVRFLRGSDIRTCRSPLAESKGSSERNISDCTQTFIGLGWRV